MNKELYDMIFKRKSFHLFRNIGNEHIMEEELKDIDLRPTNIRDILINGDYLKGLTHIVKK